MEEFRGFSLVNRSGSSHSPPQTRTPQLPSCVTTDGRCDFASYERSLRKRGTKSFRFLLSRTSLRLGNYTEINATTPSTAELLTYNVKSAGRENFKFQVKRSTRHSVTCAVENPPQTHMIRELPFFRLGRALLPSVARLLLAPYFISVVLNAVLYPKASALPIAAMINFNKVECTYINSVGGLRLAPRMTRASDPAAVPAAQPPYCLIVTPSVFWPRPKIP
jgi:hypothetical protein